MGEISRGGLPDLNPKLRLWFWNLPDASRLSGSGSLDLLDWSGLRYEFSRLIETRRHESGKVEEITSKMSRDPDLSGLFPTYLDFSWLIPTYPDLSLLFLEFLDLSRLVSISLCYNPDFLDPTWFFSMSPRSQFLLDGRDKNAPQSRSPLALSRFLSGSYPPRDISPIVAGLHYELHDFVGMFECIPQT